jgi:hypothetical protein
MKNIVKRSLVALLSLTVIALGTLASIAITPQQYATMMLTGAGRGSPGGGAPGGGPLTYTPTDISQAWNNSGGTSITFTGANIGPVAADRIVVVSLSLNASSAANAHPSSVTVGGLSMTLATGTLGEGASTAGFDYIYWRLVTAADINATTANIVVNATSINNIAITVGNINGSATASVNDSQGFAWSQAVDPRGAAAATVLAGGVLVTVATIDRNTTTAWTGATLDNNNQNAASFAYTHAAAHGTNGSPTFTGANNFLASIVAAAFKP